MIKYITILVAFCAQSIFASECFDYEETTMLHNQFWSEYPDTLKKYMNEDTGIEGLSRLFYRRNYTEDALGVIRFMKENKQEMVFSKESSAVVGYTYEEEIYNKNINSWEKIQKRTYKFPSKKICVKAIEFLSKNHRAVCGNNPPYTYGYWFSFEKVNGIIYMEYLYGGADNKLCIKKRR